MGCQLQRTGRTSAARRAMGSGECPCVRLRAGRCMPPPGAWRARGAGGRTRCSRENTNWLHCCRHTGRQRRAQLRRGELRSVQVDADAQARRGGLCTPVDSQVPGNTQRGGTHVVGKVLAHRPYEAALRPLQPGRGRRRSGALRRRTCRHRWQSEPVESDSWGWARKAVPGLSGRAVSLLQTAGPCQSWEPPRDG